MPNGWHSRAACRDTDLIGRCHDCGQDLEKIDGEWRDAIGVGCSGRGEWGEVLPHRPAWIQDPVTGATFAYIR